MITISFNGESIQEIAKEARQFAESILVVPISDKSKEDGEQTGISSYEGYKPIGVGSPGDWYPVDDGREWSEEAIKDWLQRLSGKGRTVVEVLAQYKIIDPRGEAKKLGLTGIQWAGTWSGPRKQAGQVMDSRRLRSWPYGHSYDEPRRLWIHESIAERVIKIIASLNL